MKINKILSICTVLLCFVLIGYIGLLTTGIMLFNISVSSLGYGGSYIIFYNTFYTYNSYRIGTSLNTCLFVFVLPCVWLTFVTLLTGTLLLWKDNKVAKIIDSTDGIKGKVFEVIIIDRGK